MTIITNSIGRQLPLIRRDSPLIWSQVAALEKTIDSRSLDIQILERRVSLLFIFLPFNHTMSESISYDCTCTHATYSNTVSSTGQGER